jgi:hypothetical protein
VSHLIQYSQLIIYSPGFKRRFNADNPFKFEDYDQTQLRLILDLKLRKQDLSATDAAKIVALDVLDKQRKRPNFGNGGAVENLLGDAKTRYMSRVGDQASADIEFDPEDFDPEYQRHLHASENLDKLFEDVVGCDDVIEKLRDYQKRAKALKALGEDPGDSIPTNFIFKGPPGSHLSGLRTPTNEYLLYRYGQDDYCSQGWPSLL